MDYALDEGKLSTIVAEVVLYPGAELQLVVLDRCFCVRRLQTRGVNYRYYVADQLEMAGPSGRKHATRRTWNRRPGSARELHTAAFLGEFNVAAEDGDIDEVWLVNPPRFEKELPVRLLFPREDEAEAC
jgi:hypothetical protein